MRHVVPALVLALVVFGAWRHFSAPPEAPATVPVVEAKPAPVRAVKPAPTPTAQPTDPLVERLKVILDEDNLRRRFRPFLETLATFRPEHAPAYLEAFDGRGLGSHLEKEWQLFLYQWGRFDFQAAWNHPRVVRERRWETKWSGPIEASSWQGWYYEQPGPALAWLEAQPRSPRSEEFLPVGHKLTPDFSTLIMWGAVGIEPPGTLMRRMKTLVQKGEAFDPLWGHRIFPLLHRKLSWDELWEVAAFLGPKAGLDELHYLARTCPANRFPFLRERLKSHPDAVANSVKLAGIHKGETSAEAWLNPAWTEETGPLGFWTKEDAVTANLKLVNLGRADEGDRARLLTHIAKLNYPSMSGLDGVDPYDPGHALVAGGLETSETHALLLARFWLPSVPRVFGFVYEGFFKNWALAGPDDFKAVAGRYGSALGHDEKRLTNLGNEVDKWRKLRVRLNNLKQGKILEPEHRAGFVLSVPLSLLRTVPPESLLMERVLKIYPTAQIWIYLHGPEEMFAWTSRITDAKLRLETELGMIEYIANLEGPELALWLRPKAVPQARPWHQLVARNKLKFWNEGHLKHFDALLGLEAFSEDAMLKDANKLLASFGVSEKPADEIANALGKIVEPPEATEEK